MKNKQAVVLLSGGLDSATALYVARHLQFSPQCLVFDYGQRHLREVEAARAIAARAGSPCKVLKIDLPWKGSSLLDKKIRVPLAAAPRSGAARIPSTYVPARNTIFLSFALSFAEAIDCRDIFTGVNALDYSGYPDCRPEYYKVFNQLSALATRAGVEREAIRVQTPLISMKKSQIIKLGVKLGVPYELTWSCYKGGKASCGKCDSCVLRAKGFREAGVADPALS
jgi:7-cyano-7-deazaguanine synthase